MGEQERTPNIGKAENMERGKGKRKKEKGERERTSNAGGMALPPYRGPCPLRLKTSPKNLTGNLSREY